MLVFFFAPAGLGKIQRNSQNIRTYYTINHRIRCIYLLFNDRCATLVDYKKLFFNTVIAKGPYTIKALVRDRLGMFCGSIAGAHKTDGAMSMYLCHGVYFRTIGHLHDDVILLLRPESFRVLLSCAN